jgi:aspartyl-tRNA(Asn)/glutamyl-tRNA(Gln) amidotransferase subunit A
VVSTHCLRAARAALAAGRLTATALVRQALDRAEASKQSLNAFAAIDWDRALRAAADSDQRYAQGRPRALEGLPIGVKDLIDTRGLETRYGSRAYLGHVPARDADVVRTLAECGAIVVGKTSTHEFAWGVSTAHPEFGDTRNPLDRTRMPGGSSGGMAAAIGDGAVAAGLGTDTGGSVRIPAALCGVAGFKPTLGALSTLGVFPLAPTLDHPGLLGRCVDDIVLLAAPFGIEVPDSDAWVSARLGIVPAIAPIAPSHAVDTSFRRAVTTLGETFACSAVDDTTLFDGVFGAFARIVLAEGAVEHWRRHTPERIAAGYMPETAERLQAARALVLGDYADAQQLRLRFTARLQALMARHDYLLLPTCPCHAPALQAASVQVGDWRGSVREALMTYTAPFNVAGFPAISIPLPATDGGLPAALQIVARPGDDGALLQIAQQIEGLLAPALAR